MPHDPTDEIFAELERKHRRDEVPEYTEPDPGLGAAAPEAIAELRRDGDGLKAAEWEHNRELMRRAGRVF